MEKEQNESTEDFIDKLLGEDADFHEFDINREWAVKENEKGTLLKWENDWDDDDAKDDFTLQLKKELVNNKKGGASS